MIRHDDAFLGFRRGLFRLRDAGPTGATVHENDGSPIIISAFCFVGVLGWAFYSWAFHFRPVQDWMVFYSAARAYLDGNLKLIFDGAAFTAALNQRFADWLTLPLNLHPWVYPPPFLLLLLPFGLLPLAVSCAVFLLIGFIAAIAAAWFCTGSGSGRRLVILSLFLCPAVPFNIMTGQNAFYTSALLLGGFGLLGRSPILGGALLGIMSFKPQLWLMVPIALVAARAWRALASAGAMALALAIASLGVFGIRAWQAWLDLATGYNALYRSWLVAGRLKGQSVFACATLLGASNDLADLAQGVAVVAAAAFVYWTFRRRASDRLRLAMLLGATMLAAPHASASDAVLLALSASLFLAALPEGRSSALHAAIAVAVWVSPLFNPPSLFSIGLATPALLMLFLASIAGALRRSEPFGTPIGLAQARCMPTILSERR